MVGPSPRSRRAPVTSRNASSSEIASTNGVNDRKMAITRSLIAPIASVVAAMEAPCGGTTAAPVSTASPSGCRTPGPRSSPWPRPPWLPRRSPACPAAPRVPELLKEASRTRSCGESGDRRGTWCAGGRGRGELRGPGVGNHRRCRRHRRSGRRPRGVRRRRRRALWREKRAGDGELPPFTPVVEAIRPTRRPRRHRGPAAP